MRACRLPVEPSPGAHGRRDRDREGHQGMAGRRAQRAAHCDQVCIHGRRRTGPAGQGGVGRHDVGPPHGGCRGPARRSLQGPVPAAGSAPVGSERPGRDLWRARNPDRALWSFRRAAADDPDCAALRRRSRRADPGPAPDRPRAVIQGTDQSRGGALVRGGFSRPRLCKAHQRHVGIGRPAYPRRSQGAARAVVRQGHP